jgi:hypothetical protein
MLHMPCQIQEMHKGKLYTCYERAPTHQLMKSNKHQAPPANKWKLLDLEVWWKYRLAGHVWVHGSKRSSLSQHCLSGNGERIMWKPTLLCKLWKLQSEPYDVYPKEGSWEVGGVIWKSAFANHPSHLSWVLHITPSTFYKSFLGSTSCGSDCSFHILHG